MKWWVADTETTGVSPEDRVVEVAWNEIDDNLEIIGKGYSLINPFMPIPAGASAVHGIRNSHVEDAPSIEHYFGVELNNYWGQGEVCLIAHNAEFDYRYLSPFMPEASVLLCTLRLTRKLYPGLDTYKLGALAHEWNLFSDDDRFHSAEGDINTLLRILRKVRDDHGLTLSEMIEVSTQPIRVEKMTFGKHKGTKLSELPKGYRTWLLNLPDLDKDLRASLLTA